MRFSRYMAIIQKVSLFMLPTTPLPGAQEALLLSLTDILRISVPVCAYPLFQASLERVSAQPSGCSLNYLMEMERFELLTPCLQGRCSPN